MNAISSKSERSTAIHNGKRINVEAAKFAGSHPNKEIKALSQSLKPILNHSYLSISQEIESRNEEGEE